jgi:hypothetical protein
MSRRILAAIAVSLLLAAAIHTDWHLARPAHHRLSLGLPLHWLVAAPVFALVAWYVHCAWSAQIPRASLWIVGGAVFVAGVVEPAWEYLVGDATFDWAFGRTRTLALAAFVVTGVVTYITVLALARRAKMSRIAK